MINVISNYSKVFQEINELLDQVVQELEITTTHNPSKIGGALFSKIRNGYAAFLVLVNQDFITESGYIVRTITESLFILKYLSMNPDDAISRLKNDSILRHERLKYKIETDHQYEYLREKLNIERKSKDSLAVRNLKETQIKKWANLADLSDIYYYVYDVLSSDSHTSLNSLENLIIIENGIFEGFKSQTDPEDLERILYAVAGIMAITFESISEIFQLEIDQKIYSLNQTMSTIIANSSI